MTIKKIKKIKSNKTTTTEKVVAKPTHKDKLAYGVPNLKAIEKYFDSHQENFTKSMRAISNQVIANPDILRDNTLASCAKKLNIGEVSIMRFCKLLGFKGFTDFKKYFIDHFFDIPKKEINPDDIYDLDVNTKSNPADVLTKATNYLASVSLETKHKLSSQINILSKAAEQIYGARNLLLISTEANRFLIEEIAYRFNTIGIMAICASSPADIISKACLLHKGDVAIAVQSSGYNKDILSIISLLQKQRVFTIGMCNDARADLSVKVDLAFTSSGTYDKNYHNLQDSIYTRVSQLLIFECIIGLVTALDIQRSTNSRLNNLNALDLLNQSKKR
ncbi:hypothetical protein CKF54_00805 [Psittacicella hinzii]|uniref:RpiR family transcriptional regulator n=1 Tax=Psittacicella hinzii TaxID=2028575 RepID=A0A3A1Y7W4_9GAMM|nr:MurR/RpiR family transcriptional regulator [Psittacicella hinzii]RIY34312.1 hypothetical protein CKF54_00805 [Psittacicella hinzii]